MMIMRILIVNACENNPNAHFMGQDFPPWNRLPDGLFKFLLFAIEHTQVTHGVALQLAKSANEDGQFRPKRMGFTIEEAVQVLFPRLEPETGRVRFYYLLQALNAALHIDHLIYLHEGKYYLVELLLRYDAVSFEQTAFYALKSKDLHQLEWAVKQYPGDYMSGSGPKWIVLKRAEQGNTYVTVLAELTKAYITVIVTKLDELANVPADLLHEKELAVNLNIQLANNTIQEALKVNDDLDLGRKDELFAILHDIPRPIGSTVSS